MDPNLNLSLLFIILLRIALVFVQTKEWVWYSLKFRYIKPTRSYLEI